MSQAGNRTPVSYEGTATVASGGIKIPFRIESKLNYFINDSASFDCLVNFNRTIGETGTFTVKALQGFSDLEMDVMSVSIQGVGGDCPVRLLGV